VAFLLNPYSNSWRKPSSELVQDMEGSTSSQNEAESIVMQSCLICHGTCRLRHQVVMSATAASAARWFGLFVLGCDVNCVVGVLFVCI
jgi:hypothetical protein